MNNSAAGPPITLEEPKEFNKIYIARILLKIYKI